MSNAIHEKISEQVKDHQVVLYMKGTPVFPMCGFSATVVQILSNTGVKFQAYNVLDDGDLRQGLKEYSNWPTFPQLYVNGELLGGCDIIREMYESGELSAFMEQQGIEKAATVE